MDYYYEYPIRCKTCNEQIACYSEDFKNYLEATNNVELALDYVGITNWCSRIAMITPIKIKYNLENRALVLGLTTVETDEIPNEENIKFIFNNQEEEEKEESFDLPIFNINNIRKNNKEININNTNSKKEEKILNTINTEPINLDNDKNNLFIEPEEVNIPKINDNSIKNENFVFIGNGNYTIILKGRTYLAR